MSTINLYYGQLPENFESMSARDISSHICARFLESFQSVDEWGNKHHTTMRLAALAVHHATGDAEVSFCALDKAGYGERNPSEPSVTVMQYTVKVPIDTGNFVFVRKYEEWVAVD